MNTVILADGDFPTHPKALQILHAADFLIACDGAADKLSERNIEPQLVIGDLDSVSKQTLAKFDKIVQKVARQDNTDLMKAMDWCVEQGRTSVEILGAVGGREDHSLGNIFAITTYATKLNILLYTDTGYFIALEKSQKLSTHFGQQISLFPQPQDMKITTSGLKYSLENQTLQYLHSGTLNEAEGDEILLEFDKGTLLVFQTYQ